MLTRSVNLGEGFFMKQDPELMLPGYPPHHIHYQLIMINGEVGFLKDRGTLKLVRSNLIMTRFYRNAQFIGLKLELFHECLYPVRY